MTWFPLEEALKEVIEQGSSLDTLAILIKFLPEEKKAHYRELVMNLKSGCKVNKPSVETISVRQN